jgi:hypothetical protein
VSADELVTRVVERVRELGAGEGQPRPTMAEVFTAEVVRELAVLPRDEYEKFKLALEAELLLMGLKVTGLTERKLDRVVEAERVRIEEERSKEPPALLCEGCPDGPDAEGLLVPGGWAVAPGGVVGGSVRVCAGAVYVAGRLVDPERARAYLRVIAWADGEWRQALVPASASVKALVKAVRDLGVLVEDEESLASYLRAFISLNWSQMPVSRVGVEEDSLFDAWREYVAERWDDFLSERLGKVVRAEEGGLLAVRPEVLERFCRAHGASMRQVLSAWRAQGWLAEGGLRPVRFRGGVRRAPVFPLVLFAVGDGVGVSGESRCAG